MLARPSVTLLVTLLCTAALALAAVGPARATTLQPLGLASQALGQASSESSGLPDGVTPLELYQGWIDRSLVPTPPGRILLILREYGCAWRGTDACTEDTSPPRITFTSGVYDIVSHYELMHEVAHVFDFELMTRRYRRDFERIMRLHGNWWAGEAPPAEKFAMGYGYCALSRGRPDFKTYWGFDYYPTAAQQRQVCELIRTAARAAHRTRG